MNTETRQALWEQYQNEIDGQYGFGSPAEWGNGPRNFAAFLARHRFSNDFERAMGSLPESTAAIVRAKLNQSIQ